MNLVAPVSSIMARDIPTVMPKDSIACVKEIFDRTKALYIPVVRYKKVVGMINKIDFMSFCNRLSQQWNDFSLTPKWLKGHTADEVMSEVPMSLECCDPIAVAVEMFRDDSFRAFPVVENENLIGLVTTHEVMEALAKEKVEECHYYSFY